MAIVHDNIIYISNISKLGGVESFAYYMAKKYKDYDIAVLCKSGDYKQLERIRKYCPAYVHRGEEIECKTIVINYDTSILDFVKCDNCYMVVHADYSQPCYKVLPNWNDKRITKVLTITKYCQKMMKEKFNVDTELCYNPLVPEEYDKPLILVSATRLSKIKRWLENESSCRRTGLATASTTFGMCSLMMLTVFTQIMLSSVKNV